MPGVASTRHLPWDCTGVLAAVQAHGWIPWMDTIEHFKCDPDKQFAQIIVPTVDTVRYTFLVDMLLAAGKHVLCVGETGTGKTLSLSTKLLDAMPAEVQPVLMTFSARTSANQTQDIIGELLRTLRVLNLKTYTRRCLWLDGSMLSSTEHLFPCRLSMTACSCRLQ